MIKSGGNLVVGGANVTKLQQCPECKDCYLTNPQSKKDGVCRTCKGKIGMSKPAKGFSYR